MTQSEINEIIKRNHDFKVEGRTEGAIWALFGGLIYLILIAAVLN